MKSIKHSLFKISDFLLPSLTARKIYQVMSNPRIRKLRDFEEDILDRAEKQIIDFQNFKIQTYTWGNTEAPMAFLVHGWEGQAGNFGSLVAILLEAGYQVKAFDAPSHGHSSKGATNMSQFSKLVSQLLEQYRPNMVISHSFGSVTSVMALSENQDIPVEKWIMVTTPHDFKDRVNQIQDLVKVSDRTMSKVIQKVESDFGTTIDKMNMEYFSDKVGHVRETVIIHSRNDKILPIESARIANAQLKQSRLIELDDYGHYSILWSDELKEIIRAELN